MNTSSRTAWISSGTVRNALNKKTPASEMLAGWQTDIETFDNTRIPYLLYE